jgi:hypothetical protein
MDERGKAVWASFTVLIYSKELLSMVEIRGRSVNGLLLLVMG